ESDQLEMPDGTWLNKKHGFQIIATMNEVKEGYEGYELGEDFEDRFGAVLEIKELPVQEKLNFLQKICNDELPYSFLTRLIKLQTSINSEKTIWRKMSLRVLERIVENIVTHPEEPLSTIIHSEFMVGYWEEGHELVNSKVSYLVSEVGEHVLLSKNSTHTQSDTITPYYDKGHLISGHLSFPLLPQSNIKSNKPTINYFNKRTKTNDRSLHQTLLGIHLNRNVLLVGPQGCGKTWLAHSVFDLLDKNVEHMSLHESTTVHDLTVWQKTVRKKDDMFIELELSPLVRSAVEGRPCIIDDVNRAPPGVLAVLNHALQFREIILPQGIDTSNPNISSNSYKVTAKKGFQLIFTATIPEDTNQINPMMADFMDRMYCINMTYLPPSEEVEVMKRLIGIKELDHDCMHQLGTLVRLINQLREKCNDGKPTFRSTERITMNLKHFPDMDIRTLLNRELRLSSREDELDLNTNDLNELYMLRDVLETQYSKPCIKCTPLNEVVYRGYNLSLPVPENEIETYDPNRWWEAGKPTLYQSERARKRQRILQRLLETVTALDIPLHPWKKPRSNALDSSSKPSWGCTFAQDIPRIKNVFFSPWDLLYRDNDESIYGLLFHEIFEILYRNTTQFSTEFLSLPGSRILVNAIGDIWINQQGMAQFPGTCDWILALYEESFDSEKLVVEHDEYPHIQFITLLLYYWRFGAINRGISTDHFGTDVINAFNSLQDKIDQIISTQDEIELIELTKQLYYTPQFQQLIKRSLYLTIEDIHISPTTISEKDAIISMASTKLTDYERNTKLSTQPVNETGRQVTSEEFEELRNFILDAIKKSRIELERLDEDNEAKKRVDELKKAELEREERLLEGITEREQKEFQVRYERVMDHIKLMRDKFRQIYRHERGIWRRHLAQGRLDSTQLASLVAGNDRVFMKREQPERYMVRISLLIDQSASMQGDKIDHVSDAVLMLLSAIQSDQRKGVNVEVVGFHDDKPMEIYLKYGEHLTKKKIIKVVNEVSRTKGRNNDLQAIYYAFERIPKHDRRSLNLIIHFSDGDPNQQFDRDQFKDLVNKYSNIIVVGFGIGAQGTNFVLDLYPEDQATIAEETSEIPERLSSLIRRYVSST
ncbi:VWA domain-containing protein, partial [Methanosalsum natronophilum]